MADDADVVCVPDLELKKVLANNSSATPADTPIFLLTASSDDNYEWHEWPTITIKPDANGKFTPQIIKADGSVVNFPLSLNTLFPLDQFNSASHQIWSKYYADADAGIYDDPDFSSLADLQPQVVEPFLQDNGDGSYTFVRKPNLTGLGLLTRVSFDNSGSLLVGAPIVDQNGQQLNESHYNYQGSFVGFKFDLSAMLPEEEPAEPAETQPGAPDTGVGANIPSGLLIVPILLVGAGLVVQRRF